ncbi:MAG: hypothetical protein Phog2KO_42560 [Phototrophicaceae bacterium]
MNNNYQIIWKEEIVGYMQDINIDNFFIYGKWMPRETRHTDNFLKQLNANVLLEVDLMKQGGKATSHTIDLPPDEQGIIEFRVGKI